MASIMDAVCASFPDSADALHQAFACARAGDINRHCRSVLLKATGAARPLCVFGNLTARCPPELYQQGLALVESYRSRAEQDIMAGTPQQASSRKYGLQFLQTCVHQLINTQNASHAAPANTACLKNVLIEKTAGAEAFLNDQQACLAGH